MTAVKLVPFGRVVVLFILLFVASPLAAIEPPFTVRCGSGEVGSETGDAPARLLPDRPFDRERGYGYAGGEPGSIDAARVAGAEGDGRVTWREGALRYTFRVSRGDYLVELAFVETDVAAPALRLFDVLIEDRTAVSSLDIFEAAGDFTWLTRSLVAEVRDGWLDLRLVPVEGKPPRISRITVRRHGKDTGSAAPTSLELRGRGGFGEVLLWWEPDGSRVAGYEVFRSDGSGSPFVSLDDRLLHVPFIRDRDVRPGRSYRYVVRAHGIDGQQGPLSPPVELEPAGDEGRHAAWKEYDLRLGPGPWGEVSALRDETVLAPGGLGFAGQVYPVEIGLAMGAGAWERRKSYIVDMSRDRYRVFRKRRELRLEADAGDFTQMRERLAAEVAARLGLASPLVETALLSRDGKFEGLRFDVERLGDRFRRRAGLDRRGPIVRLARSDRGPPVWEPYGELVGEEGDVVALNRLVQALHGLHEGGARRFFEERFYLDRVLTRLAFAAVRGEMSAPPESYTLLRDSRNGRWEFFRQRHAHGAWGVRDHDTELIEPTPERVERMLFPQALVTGHGRRDSWMLFLTRLFDVPEIRERYLERVEELIAGELSPERFDALVGRVHAEVRGPALRDPFLWPFDHGASFGEAPAKLEAGHRRRVEALTRAVEAERRREGSALRIEAFALRPAKGEPRVTIGNRSGRSVDLSAYRLATGFGEAPRALAASGSLEPGDSLEVELSRARGQEAKPSGGALFLWQKPPEGALVLSDLVFYGHQTRGFAYRRHGEDGRWAFFDLSREDGRPLEAPPLDFLEGVEEQSSGDLTIWFKPLGEAWSPEDLAEVVLRYRSEKAEGYDQVRLLWDQGKFRYSLGLEANAERGRTAYYFVARTPEGVERVYPPGAPDLTYFIGVPPEVYINELCPRPEAGPDSPGEFIELYNASDRAVSLEGWYLTDDRRVPTKWRITEDIVLGPKAYVLFWADGLHRGRHTSFRLGNSGEFVGLCMPVSEGNLRVDAMTFRGVPAGESWGRRQDGTQGYRVWKDPTPGRRNLPKVPERFLEKDD